MEATLLGQDLGAEVLKVGHHGSRTSSSEAFLDAVQPEIALISAGQGNTFGHPHVEVLERLAARGITVRRTDQEGWVRVIFAPRLRSVSSRFSYPRSM